MSIFMTTTLSWWCEILNWSCLMTQKTRWNPFSMMCWILFSTIFYSHVDLMVWYCKKFRTSDFGIHDEMCLILADWTKIVFFLNNDLSALFFWGRFSSFFFSSTNVTHSIVRIWQFLQTSFAKFCNIYFSAVQKDEEKLKPCTLFCSILCCLSNIDHNTN